MSTPASLAVQLYTFRATAEAHGLRPVLERVAAAGFLGVEFASLHGTPPEVVGGWVKDLGLTTVAVHRKLPAADGWNALLDEVAALGTDRIVVPWVEPETFAELGSIQKLGADLHAAQQRVAGHGLSLGYHNHWFELQHTFDGRSGLEQLFAAAGPDVFAEIDTYWVRVGGADPAAIVAALGDRVQLLHIKDGPADAIESDHVAVGTGAMDVPGVIAAGTAVDWHIVELDRCATDLFAAVEQSGAWLTSRGLTRGRA